MLKKEIRTVYAQKRLELAFHDAADRSVLMVFQFNGLVLPPPAYLLSYFPLAEKNEFDVRSCEDVIKKNSPLVKIAWPKTNKDLTMEARMVENENMFVKNQYNILEPLDGLFIPTEKLDMVFVPMLAFDTKGYRVGYGKGFYDKYLISCRPDVVKIGFSYFEPVAPIEDLNEFDVPLNFCITPTRIYEF